MKYLACGFCIFLAYLMYGHTWIGVFICLGLAYLCLKSDGQESGNSSLFSGRIGRLMGGPEDAPMVVEREYEHELVVRGSNRVLIINRRKQTVAGIDQVLARYSDVKAVRISHPVNADDWPDTYAVTVLTNKRGSLQLGMTADEVGASIMAAKLASWLETEVVT